ncbi:hypothetical protein QUF76_09615 [Desulfobacterales bacterium HSG16]|nr:hypothetical protein [Desulfobacterales bacterium HSG16]
MPDRFEFRIQGPDAEKVAAEFADLIKEEFGQRPTAANPGTEEQEAEKALDPGTLSAYAGLAAAILSMPASFLAADDMIGRMTQSKKIDRLLGWVKTKKQQSRDISFRMITPKGLSISFDMSSSTEIMEAASEKNDE